MLETEWLVLARAVLSRLGRTFPFWQISLEKSSNLSDLYIILYENNCYTDCRRGPSALEARHTWRHNIQDLEYECNGFEGYVS